MQMVSHRFACGLALTVFVLTAAGLVLDRVAAAEGVSGAGAWWLYPLLVAAICTPAAVGALIVARRPRNPRGRVG